MALTKIQAAGLTADLIDETKLADNSIDSEHYNDGSIDNAHLADDAVGVDELSATGTASSSTFLRGDNSWATPTDTNTQLSTEEVQDIVGAMFTGNTETNITATYEDSDGTIDLVSTDTNTTYSVGDGGLTQNNFTNTLKTKLDGIATSANNYVHPNHSGEVTSTADGAQVVADDVIDEANLKVDNSPTNDYVLTAKSSAAGGLTWAAASGGGGVTSDSDRNTVAGTNAGNSITGSSGYGNSCYGYDAGTAITTGDYNTVIGSYAGDAIDTGSENTAVGRLALSVCTSGNSNVAIGDQALEALETAQGNTAVGQGAGTAHTTAANNVYIGQHAGAATNTGHHNVFMGQTCGYANTTGFQNVAIGALAFKETGVDAQENVVIGYNAGTNIEADKNVAVGANALVNYTGSINTALGYKALYAADTGDANTCVGFEAGKGLTSGDHNVCIGLASGAYTNIQTTSTKCTMIGSYSHASAATGASYQTVIGYNKTGKGNSTTFLEGSVYNSDNNSAFSTTSDRRIKKNIIDNNDGLSKINSIRVRNFEYRTLDEVTEFDNPKAAWIDKEGTQIGVIAQEIMEVLPDVVKQESTGAYSVNPENLTWYLVNAVKELSAKVTELEEKLNA